MRPWVGTSGWPYEEWKGSSYPAEVDAWAAWIRAQSWEKCYLFFKHEDEGTGPKPARSFLHPWSQGNRE